MNRRITPTTVGLVLLAGQAVAQEKSLEEQLVGTWLIATADNIRADGSRFQGFGPNPKGILMFDANGWFSFQLAQPGRPKFISDNRLQGTAEENKATVQGSLSYYGKYSVDEVDRVLHLYIESSLWPNFDGIDNKRIIVTLARRAEVVQPSRVCWHDGRSRLEASQVKCRFRASATRQQMSGGGCYM